MWLSFLGSIPLLLWTVVATCYSIKGFYYLGADSREGQLLSNLDRTVTALSALSVVVALIITMALVLTYLKRTPQTTRWLVLPAVIGVATYLIDLLLFFMISGVAFFYIP